MEERNVITVLSDIVAELRGIRQELERHRAPVPRPVAAADEDTNRARLLAPVDRTLKTFRRAGPCG